MTNTPTMELQGMASLPSYAMPTMPCRNKVDWQPDGKRAALLVHDMQEYFLRKFDMARAPIPELLHNAARLLDAFRTAGAPIIYTAQPTEQPAHDRALLNDFWGPGLTAPEVHAQQGIVDALRPHPGDVVLTKWRYSAFQRADLAKRLQAMGRDQLVVCGVYAHIGCLATCLEAFMRDIQPFLVADAVADFSREEHVMALRYVATRCGVSLTTQAVAQAIAGQARGNAAATS